ncbi:hypothetical protein ALC56_14649 [Trachymyrmex septentrionalis]|uniref:Uncharacterized protein n=1 Tax=Trachymyrmex septentrionalis TaxID=34720 RepID=A0A195ERI7_9HYME|nr:hypothetical protein ALC56_14649 [Trachymyrmex septentrionalis]
MFGNYSFAGIYSDEPEKLNGLSASIQRLTIPIQFGPEAIKFSTKDIAENDTVIIAAWGSTGYEKPLHENLQKLYAKSMLPKKCQSYHKIMFIDKILYFHHL